MESVYAAYQSLLPHRYRLHKFKDHYHGPHIGMLKFQQSLLKKQTNHNRADATQYKLTMNILNHLGEPVMTAEEPISFEPFSRNITQAYTCKPIRGELSSWRYALCLLVLMVRTQKLI